MRIVDRPIGEDELHAYVDGRLDAAARAVVEQYIGEQPEVAGRVDDYRRQREALRAAFDRVAHEPIPARLRVDGIAAALAIARRRRLVSVAAVAAWLLVGGTAGWTVRTAIDRPVASPDRIEATANPRPMEDALVAHRVYVADAKHPIEVGADQRTHLQTWLSKRVGRRLTAPDLAASGYALLGGRLLAASTGPAALFMYQNAKGERLTLYVRPSAGGTSAPVELIDDGALRAGYWYEGGFGFAVAAEDERATVLEAAQSAQRQLSI